MTAVTYRVPSAVLTEREHVVPLDHSKPDGPKITVFSRELAHPDGLDKPYLIFQQGGPGFEATRPTAPPSGWQKRAIADYFGACLVTMGEVIQCEFSAYPNVDRWVNNVRQLSTWKQINEAHYGFVNAVKDKPFQRL